MKKYFVFLSAVVFAIIFSSCAKVPQAELDTAQASLGQAKAAQADIYLENEYLAIVDSMNVINTEIETQKSKMFGSFGKVKEKLTLLNEQSNELVVKTETRKEEIKSEVAKAQTEIAKLMEECNSMVGIAPKGKEGKAAIEAIKTDLATINTTVLEVPVLVESGNLLAAQTKVNAAKQKATDINNELKTVLEKYKK